MSLNMVVLTGRLTGDPELKYTQSGKAFLRMSLAVNRSYNRDEVDFINCMAWEKKAELIAQYLRKGSQCAVNGSLRVSNYEDDEGKKRRSMDVLVDNVEFLDGKKKDDGR